MKQIIFICLALLVGCSAVNSNFVIAVDDAMEVILPRYVHYVSLDTELDADAIKVIIQSVNELKLMIKEERERHGK